VLVASLARLSAEERRHVSALVQSMLDAAGPDDNGAGRLLSGPQITN
jgi:hypothetical protein